MTAYLLKSEILKRLMLGSFAIVMAMGIVSIAAHMHGFKEIASILYYVSILVYIILTVGILFRWFRDGENLGNEFRDGTQGPGALTIVCGTAVLGSQIYLIGNQVEIAFAFFVLSFVLWLFISYGLLLAFTVEKEISLMKSMSGSWLLFIVAAQSTSILLTNLVPEILPMEFLLLSTALFYAGLFLYIMIITLIMYRYTFLTLNIEQLSPPYWINMGALAISVYAGCVLVENAGHWDYLAHNAAFLTFIATAMWTFCIWWIPLIVALGVWKYIIKQYRITYTVDFWSMVFPLGMFSACTYKVEVFFGLDFFSDISMMFFIIACIAWLTILVGMLSRLNRLKRDTVTR